MDALKERIFTAGSSKLVPILKEQATNSERQQRWEKVDRFFRETGVIEPGILDTVVALNVVGINTHSSCEGHQDKDRFDYPNVTVRTRESRSIYKKIYGLRKSKDSLVYPDPKVLNDIDTKIAKLEEHWKVLDEAEAYKIQRYLDEFYSTRQPSRDLQLVVDEGTMLKSRSANSARYWWNSESFSRIKTPAAEEGRREEVSQMEDDRKKLQSYRAEMNEFAKFLKYKYYSNGSTQSSNS